MKDAPKAFATSKRIIRRERAGLRAEETAPPGAEACAPDAAQADPAKPSADADAEAPIAARQAEGATDKAPARPEPVAPASARNAARHGWAKRARRRGYLVQAAAVAVAVGLGWGVGYASRGPAPARAATPESVQALSEEILRFSGDLRSLKSGVEVMREGIDRSRQDTAARLQQWGERFSGQADQASDARVPALIERLERAERAAATQATQIGERLDRIEKQAAQRAAAAGPATPPAPEQTGSVAEPRPKTRLENWALREVYNGIALVEGERGNLVEVAPGQNLPGAGRVESIERRGKAWIVVTSRGLITSQQW